MKQLRLVLIAALSILSKASFKCLSSLPCIIDCGSTNNCSGIVDAMNATSLTLYCNTPNACANSTIYLPNDTSSISTIICSASHACSYTEIYYLEDATSMPSNHNINLICNTTDHSCYYTQLNSPNAGKVKFDCNSVQCDHPYIYAQNANYVEINCKGPSSIGPMHGCDEMMLDASNVTDLVQINCSGNDGCTGIYDSTNANALIIHVSEDGIGISLSGTYFYGENVKTLYDVTCIGGASSLHYDGCSGARFYLPSSSAHLANIFHLNCYGYGCMSIELYSFDGFATLSSSNILFNGCTQCKGDPSNCITLWKLYCKGNTYNPAMILKASADDIRAPDMECDAPHVASLLHDTYKIDQFDPQCLVPDGQIICNETSDCVVDCATQPCKTNVIDAFKANSLIVACEAYTACQHTLIITPNNSLSETYIKCNASSACLSTHIFYTGDATTDIGKLNHKIEVYKYGQAYINNFMYIIAPNAGNIIYECNGHCVSPVIHAEKANNLTIHCNGCLFGEFYATNVTSLVSLKCGDNGCEKCELFAQNANSVSIYSGYHGMIEGEYHGESVTDSFEITCLSGWDNSTESILYGCDNVKFWLPSYNLENVLQLNCYAYGCNNIAIYSPDGFDAVTNNNFLFNGCGQCWLDSKLNNCVNRIGIGCADSDLETDIFNGTNCGLQYQCGCSNFAAQLMHVFDSNYVSDANCYGTEVTISTTSSPTSSSPTNSPPIKMESTELDESKANEYLSKANALLLVFVIAAICT